ncbi:MAG: hypothetical protein EOO53_01855 [Gammaproteobacteria bacterium]|nr:MAG: hypothetical protein EOO53_01855 [Gammaproteobacteria bacterium]
MDRNEGDSPNYNTSISVVVTAIAIILSAILIYYFNFAEPNCYLSLECLKKLPSDSPATWGVFGDFLGGVINPFIGLLTVVLLVASIKQQNLALAQNEKALKLSNEELAATREEIKTGREIQLATEAALKAQIAEAKSLNDFQKTFKHWEEFERYLATKFSDENVETKMYIRRLYQLCFPSPIENNFSLSSNIWRSLYNQLIKVHTTTRSADLNSSRGIELYALDLNNQFLQVFDVLQGSFSWSNVGLQNAGRNFFIGPDHVVLTGHGVQGHLSHFLLKLNALYDICAFDHQFDRLGVCLEFILQFEKVIRSYMPGLQVEDGKIPIIENELFAIRFSHLEPHVLNLKDRIELGRS